MTTFDELLKALVEIRMAAKYHSPDDPFDNSEDAALYTGELEDKLDAIRAKAVAALRAAGWEIYE